MSRLLDSIALLDPIRRADLRATDAAIHYVAQNPCASCVVTGGDAAPGFCGLCQACRSLAAVFAAREMQ